MNTKAYNNINTEISFKDLLSLYPDENFYFAINSFKDNLIAYEDVLCHKYSSSIPSRPYFFIDMLTAFNLLSLFCYLEEAKYAKYMVNCRTLLHKYLYSGYNIRGCFLGKANINFKLCTTLDINVPMQYSTQQIYFDDQKNLLSYPTSIRKHFETYIKSKCNVNPIYIHTILASQPNKTEDEREYQPRYYMPVYQVPEFLFSFLYFDGRKFPSNFEENSNSRIPKLCTQNQNSEFSYKLVVNQISDFLNNTNLLYENELIYHKCHLDRLFFLYKLDTLSKYYELYISDFFLDTMINIFQLSYKEVAQLKKTIITDIWNDTNFLIDGHNSPFIDFMLPFDIYFQYNLFFAGNIHKFEGLKGLDGLKKVIYICKECTRQTWKFPLCSIPSTALSMNGDFIDIIKTQDNIKEILRKNSFYLKYYFNDAKQCQSIISSSPLNQPFSFEILKYLLPQ